MLVAAVAARVSTALQVPFETYLTGGDKHLDSVMSAYLSACKHSLMLKDKF